MITDKRKLNKLAKKYYNKPFDELCWAKQQAIRKQSIIIEKMPEKELVI